ncbi:MAG: phosphomethylpyrimidine synthase ThiC, partial [Actinomycetota bacterium]|nr:phosphomethylpyrimidine synthase ThiC [Actinomycetota bacterium]
MSDGVLAQQKQYVNGSRPGVRVPFREVALHATDGPGGCVENPPVRLYDTSGPGSDPSVGLPPLRAEWILGRGDVEPYAGRPVQGRDDGRSAARRGGAQRQFEGRRSPVLRARPGATVTQMHYARRGEVTPEMEFVAIREGVEPELVRSEIARG